MRTETRGLDGFREHGAYFEVLVGWDCTMALFDKRGSCVYSQRAERQPPFDVTMMLVAFFLRDAIANCHLTPESTFEAASVGHTAATAHIPKRLGQFGQEKQHLSPLVDSESFRSRESPAIALRETCCSI